MWRRQRERSDGWRGQLHSIEYPYLQAQQHTVLVVHAVRDDRHVPGAWLLDLLLLQTDRAVLAERDAHLLCHVRHHRGNPLVEPKTLRVIVLEVIRQQLVEELVDPHDAALHATTIGLDQVGLAREHVSVLEVDVVRGLRLPLRRRQAVPVAEQVHDQVCLVLAHQRARVVR